MKLGMRRQVAVLLGSLLALAGSVSAEPVRRETMLERAEAFARLSWKARIIDCPEQCACPSAWESDFDLGEHEGMAYHWGGHDPVDKYLANLNQGFVAGSHRGTAHKCATGVDCSGFVSRVWGTAKKYSTRNMHEVSEPIDFDDLLPGDALNKAGSHIVLYAGRGPTGVPIFYEAAGGPGKVVLNHTASWARLNGYSAIRYKHVVAGGIECKGTTEDPIRIESFPFTDGRTMFLACSDAFTSYSCKPDAKQSGKEFIYTFKIDGPGTLEASVSDPPFVDIDLHLLSKLSQDKCIDRHDRTLTTELTKPGRYYLVADTFTDRADIERAGPFELKVTFTSAAAPDAPEAAAETEAVPEAPVTPASAEASTDPDSPGGADDRGCGCRSGGHVSFTSRWMLGILLVIGVFWRKRER